MKISREKLIQVWSVLSQLAQEKTTAKGAYGIAKNKRLLEDEIKSIEDAQKAIEYPAELEEFNTKRLVLCREYASKDEKGEPIVNNQAFVIPDRTEFDKELAALREEYKEPLDVRQKIDEDFHKFLIEETEISVHVIKLEDLPNGITAAQIELLGEIITE